MSAIVVVVLNFYFGWQQKKTVKSQNWYYTRHRDDCPFNQV